MLPDNVSPRAWYRFHLASWLLAGLVLGAIVSQQMGSSGGWPWDWYSHRYGRPSYDYAALLRNLAVSLALAAATLHTTEKLLPQLWPRPQFSLRGLFKLVAIVAVLLGARLTPDLQFLMQRAAYTAYGLTYFATRCLIAFALGCGLYALIDLVFWFNERLETHRLKYLDTTETEPSEGESEG